MEPFILAFIAIGLLVLLVFMIYLVDRVNAIEKETRQFFRSLKGPQEDRSLGPFAGFTSKKLWDAMTGRIPDGIDPSVLAEVRERYEPVLQKHIEAIFQEGVIDGQRGISGDPKNTKLIASLHGTIESWLPSAQVNTIYKCGLDSLESPSTQGDALRNALDESAQTLYAMAQLTLREPPSSTLMPQAVVDAPDTAVVPPAAQ
jgi:hypothetical protein